MAGVQFPTLPNSPKPVDRLDRHRLTPLAEATLLPSGKVVPACFCSQLCSMQVKMSEGVQFSRVLLHSAGRLHSQESNSCTTRSRLRVVEDSHTFIILSWAVAIALSYCCVASATVRRLTAGSSWEGLSRCRCKLGSSWSSCGGTDVAESAARQGTPLIARAKAQLRTLCTADRSSVLS